MTRLVATLSLWCVVSTGCSESPTSPTPVTESVPVTAARLFTGQLRPHESQFYSFTVGSAGFVSVMLSALSTGGIGSASRGPVHVAIGVPAGHGCSPIDDGVAATPALTPQIVRSVLPGVYCVRVADAGNLPVPMTFTVRITYP